MHAAHRRTAPVWLIGLSNATFGLMGGFIVLPLPAMLAARGVPEWKIAAVSAACLSPGFWVFLLGPLLDVWLSRRAWAGLFAAVAGIGLAAGVLLRGHLLGLEAAVMLGYAGATLSSNALGGWLATLVPAGAEANHFESRLSAWTQVGLFLGNGLMAAIAGEALGRLPTGLAAVLLGSLVVLPAAVFPFMPVPAGATAQARHEAATLFAGFGTFFREVTSLLRRREVLLTLLLFTLPTGSFALTNLLGGVTRDFGATEAFASRMGGAVLSVAGALSCLLLPPLARRFRVLPLYLGIASVGALFTLALRLLPRNPATFAVAFLGENVFQAVAFTTEVAITFRVIGRNNPLAATQFGLLTAATVLPILYMGVLDGRVYTRHGLGGTLGVDGGLCLLACMAMVPILRRWARPPEAA